MNLSGEKERLDGAVGYWWNAGSPESKVPGVLRRDKDAGLWGLDIVGRLCSAEEGEDTRPTIYGETFEGLISIQAAFLGHLTTQSGHSTLPPSARRAETWNSFSVTIGGHFQDGQLWGSLSFDLALTWDWFSPTVLEGQREDGRDPLDDDFYEECTADLNGVEVAVWRGGSQNFGRSRRERRGIGGYRFASPQGFTREQLEQPILAVENLHEVLFGAPCTPEGYMLVPLGDDVMTARVFELPARSALIAEPQIPDPYFGTNEVKFSEFIPRWISLHCDADRWPSLGPPPGSGGWLQTQVVEAVNAAEALARHLQLGKSEPSSREQAVLDAVADLPRPTRELATRALEVVRDTLAERLEALALTIGPASAPWLLGSVRDWATLSGQVRNALSHGYASTRKHESDPLVLSSVLTSVRVVQKLAMVRASGFMNSRTRAPDELLADDVGGASRVRHPNSALAADIKLVRQSRDVWQTASGRAANKAEM